MAFFGSIFVMAKKSTSVQLSDKAAQRILEIIDKKKSQNPQSSPKMLRLEVAGGGCAGFQYKMTLERQKNNDDMIIENGGAMMVIDAISLSFLKGAELDYVCEPIGSYFKVNNPNAIAGCGCGSSFSVG